MPLWGEAHFGPYPQFARLTHALLHERPLQMRAHLASLARPFSRCTYWFATYLWERSIYPYAAGIRLRYQGSIMKPSDPLICHTMSPRPMSLQAALMAWPIESNFTGVTRFRSGIFSDGIAAVQKRK